MITESMAALSDQQTYSPLNYNSNTVVDLSLCAAGFDLPQDDTFGNHWAPASLDDEECRPIPISILPDITNDDFTGPDITAPEHTSSPVILDLDGDGVETRSLEEGIFFDHDGNHFAENTGWVAADDGLLVWDKDHNGEIETGNELFGDHTQLADGTFAANGYEALQALDGNHDGVLNADDAIWQELNVWQDRNGNAQVDEGELLSLNEAGIAAINTDYQKSTRVDEQGNAHKQTSEITMLDGSTHHSADVWFATNMGYTRYTEDVNVSHEIRELPYIRGFGNMADLHIAMSQDPALREMVEQFIASPYASEAENYYRILYLPGRVSPILQQTVGEVI